MVGRFSLRKMGKLRIGLVRDGKCCTWVPPPPPKPISPAIQSRDASLLTARGLSPSIMDTRQSVEMWKHFNRNEIFSQGMASRQSEIGCYKNHTLRAQFRNGSITTHRGRPRITTQVEHSLKGSIHKWLPSTHDVGELKLTHYIPPPTHNVSIRGEHPVEELWLVLPRTNGIYRASFILRLTRHKTSPSSSKRLLTEVM